MPRSSDMYVRGSWVIKSYYETGLIINTEVRAFIPSLIIMKKRNLVRTLINEITE